MDAIASKPRFNRAYALLTALLVVAIVAETIAHGFVWQLPVFAVAPDFALLLGIAPGPEKGRLHPRAVPVYNLVHRFWGPVALAALAVGLDLGAAWVIAALAWGAHVALDRTVGYGLRTPDGFQRG